MHEQNESDNEQQCYTCNFNEVIIINCLALHLEILNRKAYQIVFDLWGFCTRQQMVSSAKMSDGIFRINSKSKLFEA